MASHTITVEGTGEVFLAREDQTVLAAMERAGRRAVAVGCRNGGCGVCAIEVREGPWQVARPMSRAQVGEEDVRAGRVLACRIRALGDLRIRIGRGNRGPARFP